METLIFYFLKVILCSGVLLMYYKLFLKDRTFHHYNRFYLLSVLVVSLLLPLLKLSYFTLEVNSDIYLLINGLDAINSVDSLNHDFNYFKFSFLAAGAVSLVFLARLIFGLVKIQRLKTKFRHEEVEGINFYHTNLTEAPFSFFRNLFWKDSIPLNSDLGQQILKHEMVHIEQKHSRDKIVLEILTAVFWFNPVFHLIKKEINLIHEYLADHKAIKNSDTRAFAQMLLASHFSGNTLPATSPFLSSTLKKRLKMLKKSKTKYSYARKILALPLLFAVAFIYMVNAENREIAAANQEITEMVANLKKDTIPPTPPVPPVHDAAVPPLPPEFQDTPPEIEAVEKELRLKENNLEPMNKEIIRNYEEEGYKFDMKNFESKHAEMTELNSKVDSYYNSADFQKKIKDVEIKARETEKVINSPEFKIKIKAADKSAKEAEKLMNSQEFKKKLQEAEERTKDLERKMNSAEFQQRIKNAEVTAQTKIIEKPLIYIDDKLSNDEEMNKLNPNKIESVHVFKKGFGGNKNGEIYIKLKK